MLNLKSQISNLKFLENGFFTTIFCLFLYSFTQVDLGLTLTEFSVWQVIQKNFQYVGYFNRPVSTVLYIIIILLLHFFYFKFAALSLKKELSSKQLWKIVLGTATILLLSYNAFSYDLFNYVFDAKIVTYYHQNPYEHKALDYLGEEMLGFMHWTHRTYPYGPVWLFLTVPLSFIAGNAFLLKLILFKALMVGSYIGSVHFIGKILSKLSPERQVFGTALFALNPLVIIESLVSAHNDIVMLFLVLTGFYFLIQKKNLWASTLFLLSYGIKFASKEIPLVGHITTVVGIILLPMLVTFVQKKISWEKIFTLAGLAMIVPIVYASMRTNFQPWYLLSIMPFIALGSQKTYSLVILSILSFFALLEYIPFLYTGNWDPPIPTILQILTIAMVASLLLVLFYKRNSIIT